ncbi:MAG: glycoside hydrolase family 2 protein [Oscillospiraceae bacterium]|nr:glycoside hydrolase family 2 protein [Oscillospiraceae bacterium]
MLMSRIYINNDWQFTEALTEDGMERWENVRLPHTCKELPYHYFSEEEYQMVCGYRKVLNVPREWEDKRVLLTIDGAAHYAVVFVNGEKCGEHDSGYTAFTIDLSAHLKYGDENILAIRLDTRESLNIPPFGFVIDYMTYGGIYRDVYLDIKEQTCIADVFVKPEIDGRVVSDVTIEGNRDGVMLRQFALMNGRRTLIAEGNGPTLEGRVENVQLWDVDHPALYMIETELIRNGRILDTHRVRAGFRSAEFKADGFYLNGRKLKIRGLNRHQSYPYVGYAMPRSMQEFDADILKKELGLNAVRTSHYPQSQYFIDRCDEIGLLVFTEMPGWQHIGDDAWKNQAVKNVEEMILQYRNHPSIILWGVRINESADDEAFYTRTNALARRLDPTRQTGGVRCIRKSQLLEDVYTYNDFVHDGVAHGCEPKAKVTSDGKKPYLVTEYNGHMFPTKAFDCEDHRVEHALRHARVLDAVASHDDISGSFGWCMADYNTHKDFGSGDRICYHGVLDMFRNPKLAAAVYASQQEEGTVLEVSSGMDIGEHPASRRGEVWIFSNADSVKMYKNGRFLKEYVPGNEKFPRLKASPTLIDDYIGNALEEQEHYPPKQARMVRTILNHIALHGYTDLPPKILWLAARCMVRCKMSRQDVVDLYTKYIGDWGGSATEYRFDAIRDGRVVKTVIKTPMNRASLQVNVSSNTLTEENSYDVAAIRIRAVDENGNLLPYCNEPLKITAEGPLQIIGPDVVSLKGGMAGTYVKTMGCDGKAAVTLSNPQLGDVKIPFEITI